MIALFIALPCAAVRITCTGDSVVLVDPALQVLGARPAGGIYTTPVGATVVNYNSVAVGPSLTAPPPQLAQDWYKEQKMASAYIQSESHDLKPILRLHNDDVTIFIEYSWK